MRAYKSLLLKAYFDRGLGVTSYVKYVLALGSFYSLSLDLNPNWIVALGVLYTISCFVIGWAWYKFKLVDTENEIQNHFNPFQREVRKKLKL